MVISGGIVWPVNWKRARTPCAGGWSVREDKPGSSQRLGGKVCFCNHALSLCLCCTALQVCSSTLSLFLLLFTASGSFAARQTWVWVLASLLTPMWPLTSLNLGFLIALQIFDDCNEPPYIMYPVEFSQYWIGLATMTIYSLPVRWWVLDPGGRMEQKG